MAGRCKRGLIGVMASFMAMLSLGGAAYAGGFGDKDFSLRFPAALSRFSSYADVAAVGGASAGSKWQTSINPASVAWQSITSRYRVSLNPQYSAILFQEDTVLHVVTESVTRDFGKYGTFQIALAQVRSNEETTRDGFKFGYDMDYVQAQWGKRFTDDFALGGNFNYASSDLTYKLGQAKLADSSSDTYGFRIGTLYRLTKNLLGGLVVDYASTPATTKYYDIFGTGMGDVRDHDRTKQFILRAGPSYEYRKDSTINLDYQYSEFRNDAGSLDIHRVFAGIDHRIADALFIRGGLAMDQHGNTSWTCGLGIYPLKELGIDVGYQYDMFPEIESEFGRSHLLTVSLSMTL